MTCQDGRSRPGTGEHTATLAFHLRGVCAQSDERGVRLSAHLYVSPADVDAILDVTREVAALA